MLMNKTQFITIEDFFNAISAEGTSYPNHNYAALNEYIYYKPKNTTAAVSMYVSLTEQESPYFNALLLLIQSYLKDYSVCSYEVSCGEELNPGDIFVKMSSYNPLTYPERYKNECNKFIERFVGWIRESKETWIAKLKIYDNFDYSEFLTNPDKIITKEDISTPRVAKSYSRTRKINDTPEEIGDFTGDGYVNQIENETYSDIAPTGTDTNESTTSDHDVERNLRILNECLNQVRNIYRAWLLDFRRKVLVD